MINSKLGFFKSKWKRSEKYEGNQKRKNHQIGSVNILPKKKAHVCLNPNNLLQRTGVTLSSFSSISANNNNEFPFTTTIRTKLNDSNNNGRGESSLS